LYHASIHSKIAQLLARFPTVLVEELELQRAEEALGDGVVVTLTG
jgi:hypothetical protein